MGDRHPVTRRGTRRVAALAAGLIAGLAVALTACTPSTAYWAERTATDLELTQELRQDPWLVPSQTQSAYVPLGGSQGDQWVEARVQTLTDVVQVPVWEVLGAQIDAAEGAGWWPYYAVCNGDWDTAEGSTGDAVEVLLARELTGGVLAQAELTVGGADGRPEAQGRTFRAVEARVPSHRYQQAGAPDRIEPTDLECTAEPGQSIGEAVDLLEDHR